MLINSIYVLRPIDTHVINFVQFSQLKVQEFGLCLYYNLQSSGFGCT